MGLLRSLGKIFNADEMPVGSTGDHQGSYGNELGMRPELAHIGDAFRDHKEEVELSVAEILAPPADLTDVDIDSLMFAEGEEAAMHQRVLIYQGVQGNRIDRATAQFENKLRTVEQQEQAAHKLQGRLVDYVDTRASNAVEGSAREHRLAGRLSGFRRRTDSIQDLIQAAGL